MRGYRRKQDKDASGTEAGVGRLEGVGRQMLWQVKGFTHWRSYAVGKSFFGVFMS